MERFYAVVNGFLAAEGGTDGKASVVLLLVVLYMLTGLGLTAGFIWRELALSFVFAVCGLLLAWFILKHLKYRLVG